MNSSTLVLFIVAGTYIVWPGFYTNLGDIAALGWKFAQLEFRRQVMLFGMKKQMKKDKKELEKFLKEFTKDHAPVQFEQDQEPSDHL